MTSKSRFDRIEAALTRQTHTEADPCELAVSLIRAGVEADHQPGTQEQRDDYLRRRVREVCEHHTRQRGGPCR